jgi:acyl carrier protein
LIIFGNIFMENEIKKIFFEVFPSLKESDFDWDKNQNDYENWDSFAQLQLITMAEEKFQIELSLDDAISITTAKKLLDLVKSHL